MHNSSDVDIKKLISLNDKLLIMTKEQQKKHNQSVLL